MAPGPPRAFSLRFQARLQICLCLLSAVVSLVSRYASWSVGLSD
jgi:hypothetical protein